MPPHVAGWQHHPVCNRKYHFVIPGEAVLKDQQQLPAVVRDQAATLTQPRRSQNAHSLSPKMVQNACISHKHPQYSGQGGQEGTEPLRSWHRRPASAYAPFAPSTAFPALIWPP